MAVMNMSLTGVFYEFPTYYGGVKEQTEFQPWEELMIITAPNLQNISRVQIKAWNASMMMIINVKEINFQDAIYRVRVYFLHHFSSEQIVFKCSDLI